MILTETTKSYTFWLTLLYNLGMAKGKLLMLRVDEEQHGQFTRAAKAAGKTASAWLRDLGAREVAPPARRALEVQCFLDDPAREGLKSLEMLGVAMQQRKAAQLAATIPGVRLGINADFAIVNVGNATVEDITTKPWLPLWTNLVQKINDDPDSFYEEVRRLCPGFKPTQAFWKLPIERQAAALDEKYPLEAE